MIIERPYNAADNEINKSMCEVFKRYAKKHNIVIAKIYIYEKAVSIDTNNSEHYLMNITECSRTTNRNISDYFYMKIFISGKQKRIPKSEW